MIKRFVFTSRPPGQAADRFAGDLHAVAGRGLRAPAPARPVRAAICSTLPGVVGAPPHDGIVILWFDHPASLRAFADWPGRDPDSGPVVVAEEVVARGADWLDRRWRTGGPVVKHMALARRADGLGRAEFSERWRSRAGRVGTVVIPDHARGLAYVQNHPCAEDADEGLYDAVNEVYFDEVEALQARADWLATTLADQPEDDLVGRSWFLAVAEEPVV